MSLFSDKKPPHGLVIVGLLALFGGLANYTYVFQFGLYSDDYAVLSGHIGQSWSALMQHIGHIWQSLPQGRPVGYTVHLLLSWSGFQLGGIVGMYAMAWGVLTLNACLLFALARHWLPWQYALLAGLFYTVYPANTEYCSITAVLFVQTSLTSLLLALNLYLRHFKWLAFGVTSLCLFHYESKFMIFAVAPFFFPPYDKSFIKNLLSHWALMILIMIAVLVIRSLWGDYRLEQMTPAYMLEVVLLAPFMGAYRSLSLFLWGPQRVGLFWNGPMVIAFALTALFIFGVFRKLPVTASPALSLKGIRGKPLQANLHAFWSHWNQNSMFQLMVIAVLMLLAGYTLAFLNYPPLTRYGGRTAVHVASSVGGVLVFILIVAAVVRWGLRKQAKKWVVLVLALYMACLMRYRFEIQQSHAHSWSLTQQFYGQMHERVAGMRDSHLIFIDHDDLEHTKFVKTFAWTNAVMLDTIYQFPHDWKHPPRFLTAKVLAPEKDGDPWRVERIKKWIEADDHYVAEALPQQTVTILKPDEDSWQAVTGKVSVKAAEPFELTSLPTKTANLHTDLYELKPIGRLVLGQD